MITATMSHRDRLTGATRCLMATLLGLVCLIGPPQVRAQDDELGPELRAWYQQVLQKLQAAQHGRIILAGEVVNEQGDQVAGVSLDLEKARQDNIWAETVYERETRVIDSTFSVDLSGYASVRLTFQKDGYQTKAVAFSMPLPEEQVQLAAEGREIGPLTFRKEDVRVVLESTGALTELNEYSERLEYAASGAGVVIDFDREHYTGESLVEVPNVHDPAQLPANAVYMIAERDAADTIAVVQRPRADSELVDVVPQRLTLFMSNPNGGFARFSPQPGADGFAQMTSAPASGYQATLVLEPQDFIEGGYQSGVLFYFKTKDKYGKGRIGYVDISAGRSAVKLATVFSVQPDGSRNVNTGASPVDNTIVLTGPVIVPDVNPPVLSGCEDIVVQCTGANGRTVSFSVTAADETDPAPVVTLSRASGSLFPVGTTPVTATATDASGNSSQCTFTVTVSGPQLGYLPPIQPAKENVIKINQTIPVKVQALCSGASVGGLEPEIRLVLGNYTEANPDVEQLITQTSTSAADTTGVMRWVAADGHYIYNLSTKGLSANSNYTILVRVRNAAGAVVSEARALLLTKK